MELGEPDASGRRRPVPVPGSETIMDVDQVINAIGQGPKLPSAEEDAAMSSLPVTRWNTFGGDEGSQHTGQEMVFSGGDVFRGPMTVVAALADGRKAAYAMDAYFRTGQIQSEPVLFNVSKGTLKTIDPEPFSVFKQAPRNRMPEIPVEQAVSSFDAVELGLTEEATRNEADRCLVCGCSAGFDCRLRDALTEFKVKWRDQTEKKIHFKTMQAVDSNVEIVLDPNKCIRCQRCHIACMTFQCSDAIDLKEYPTFIDGKCVHCGLCVDLCPTGALLVKRDGRAVDRFDWKSVASHCVNCGIGCALDLKVSGQRLVWIKDGKQEAPNHSSTCRRGRFRIYDDLWYGQRISQPMIKQDGSWQEVSWDQAVDAVVQGFKRTADTAGAGAIAAVGSPQASNESLYLLQKWLRVGYSSHGLDFPGRVTHERLLEKMEETIGFAGMTQELAGLDRAEAVFLVGDGIEELAPVVATLVRRAARQRQVPVFQIASREDGLTPLATGPVKAPAGAWHKALQGILAAAASSGAVAGEMLAKAGLKVDQLKNKLGATDLKAAASNSGVPAGTLEQMAAALSKNGKVAFVFPENLLETDDTAGCVTTLIQLAALTGNLGGANAGGLYPLTNEINVSGAQLMGISPNYLPGGVKITSATARKNIAKIWQATKMPAAPATALLAALDSQQIKALFVQQAARLGDAYLQRLGQVDFLVLQEAVTSPAMDMAQVVLPMAAFGEQEGTVVNMERRLLKLQQAFAPCGAALADWEAIARIMAAQGLPAPKDLNELHQEWNEVVAGMAGFPFNGKLAEGIQLPYNKDSGSGTCCFDASTVKKMKLGL
ncbi:MAG TPA: hypothetical protein DCZ69_06420 [Syntrophobacteraceae bacterium]|nr:hypothetical protein [Syntrophobacteraceae bacterium]